MCFWGVRDALVFTLVNLFAVACSSSCCSFLTLDGTFWNQVPYMAEGFGIVDVAVAEGFGIVEVKGISAFVLPFFVIVSGVSGLLNLLYQ